MAVFLLKGKLGVCYAPPAATGTVFGDVPANGFAAAWIEDLAARGITGGCGGGNYCPTAPVTRAQMAVFLLKTSLGTTYAPPPASGSVFQDVPVGSFAADWIEDLAARNITAGCSASPSLYCPATPNTRGQMATFITKTFRLQ
jgi:sulfur transfer complex TusBCD TusB component (DsrH family)